MDMRESGVLDVPAQAVIKRIMIANVRAGCDAKAMVIASMVGKLQSKRLGQEAEQQSGTFDSVPDALASVTGEAHRGTSVSFPSYRCRPYDTLSFDNPFLLAI